MAITHPRLCAAITITQQIRNSSLKGVMQVASCILDPDVLRFRHAPSVAIGIFYLPIEYLMLNRFRSVKWLVGLQQPMLKIDKPAVCKYILIISKHQSANFVSPLHVYLYMDYPLDVGHSGIYKCITESDWLVTSVRCTDTCCSCMIYQFWDEAENCHLQILWEV